MTCVIGSGPRPSGRREEWIFTPSGTSRPVGILNGYAAEMRRLQPCFFSAMTSSVLGAWSL